MKNALFNLLIRAFLLEEPLKFKDYLSVNLNFHQLELLRKFYVPKSK